MNALALRDLGQVLDGSQARLADSARPTKRRADAEVAIREIQVLRADLDVLAPPEAAALAEHLVDAYRGTITSGDHLRLPQMTSFDGPAMRAAIQRILAVDTSRAAGAQSDVIKEERMRRVIRALDGAVADIQRQANLSLRY